MRFTFFRKVWLTLCLSLQFWFQVTGQVTRITGIVTDKNTGEPLPYVNIVFNNRTIGVTTDFEGKYFIETKQPGDSLIASFVGYIRQIQKVEKGKFQIINFQLEPHEIELPPVTIVAGENPAEILLRKIIENKPLNDPSKYDAYEYEAYTRIQIDLSNITDRLKQRKVFRSFEFIFDYVDTSAITGKTFLPVFLSESLSTVYYRKNPRASVEKIHATKVSGISNESITQFLGDKFQYTNVYDNYIQLFDKNFISPVASFALNFYRYYLVDSAYHGNQWCYKIMFKPRRKQTLTFTGHVWVHDTTFAIKEVELRIAEDANINYINDFLIQKTYDLIDGQFWLPVRDYMIGDFNLFENTDRLTGILGRKTTTYRNYIVNQPRSDDFYNTPINIITEPDAATKSETFWESNRHEELTESERNIYYMVDTLKTIPRFRTYADILEMIATGYYVKGNFEFGPYGSIVSYNDLEGLRFRFGGRTSNDFSKRVMLGGYMAYGTRDRILKFNADGLLMINKNPRQAFGLSYKNDLEQLGTSQNAFREDFFLTFLLRRNPATKLTMVSEYHCFYEHEWFNGLMNRINIIQRQLHSPKNDEFRLRIPDDTMFYYQTRKSLTYSEIRLDTRLAWREKILMGEFLRTSLGSRYPILEIRYGYGFPRRLNGEFEYHRLQVGLNHWFNVLNLGWSKYLVEAGRIWGKVPYPLLKLHEGNETYFFDEYANNNMDYFEFASDKYLSIYYTHHFDGYFFNRIPLIRKLKWREVIHGRALFGGIDQENLQFSVFPDEMHVLSKPYYEVGIGVENIFKVLRIDGIWRLSYTDHAGINRFGVFLNMQLQF